MSNLPIAQIHNMADVRYAETTVTLVFEDRFLRRKRLVTEDGWSFIVDLEKTTSLEHGDSLELNDGRLVRVQAASEEVLEITGCNLARLAWHIGNRHTPCQVLSDRLRIRNDKVIAHMLEHLGATLTVVSAPFTPEGGAYGHGRTHSHEHGHSAHV